MAKLFYDIIPSQQIKKDQTIKPKQNKKQNKKKKRFSFWFILLGGLMVILLGGFIYQLKFTSFRLTVWPKMQVVSLEKEILVKVNSGPDDQVDAIAGKFLTDSQEATEQFSATGEIVKGKKAEGTIRVYNNLRPSEAMTLRAQTRFLSSAGKYFRSPEKIYLPPAQWVSGKLVPSWVDTAVVALEEGPDYNIKPDRFSVPGLAGTVYYSDIYGQSFGIMEGGEVVTVPQVSEEDLQKARKSLEEKLFTLSQQALEQKVESDFIFLPSALSQEIQQDQGSSVKVGEEVSQFDYTLSVTSRAIVFSKSQVDSLIKKAIQDKIGAEKIIVPESLMVTYHPLAINFDQQAIDCNLQATAKVYSVFQEEALKKLVAGKILPEAQRLIEEQFPQFEEFKGQNNPFWKQRIPSDLSRIQVIFYFNH